MIPEAAAFAKKAHEGMVRKGTGIPYITHPMEVAVIVSQITDDPDMIAAAFLHDVLEDTCVTREELASQFGSRVLDLVESETEDKTKSWKERKQNTINRLSHATRDEKILMLADKLSNMRDTAKEYLVIGDALWERFNEKRKECQAWYYDEVIKQLSDMSEYPAYQELVNLSEYVFRG